MAGEVGWRGAGIERHLDEQLSTVAVLAWKIMKKFRVPRPLGFGGCFIVQIERRNKDALVQILQLHRTEHLIQNCLEPALVVIGANDLSHVFDVIERLVVDACDKTHVVVTRQAALKSPLQP